MSKRQNTLRLQQSLNPSTISAEQASTKLQALELEIISINGFINKLKSYLTFIPLNITKNTLFSDYNERYATHFSKKPGNAVLSGSTDNTVISKFLELQTNYLTIIDSSPEYRKLHDIDTYISGNSGNSGNRIKNLQSISTYGRRHELYNFGEQRYITLFRYLIFMVESVLAYIDTISRCPKDNDEQMLSYATQMNEYYTKQKTAKLQNQELFRSLKHTLSTKLKEKERKQSTNKKNLKTAGKEKTRGFFRMPDFFTRTKRRGPKK